MNYPSRLRPQSQDSAPEGHKTTAAIVESAQARAAQIEATAEAQTRVNPLHTDKLIHAELTARINYGKAKRESRGWRVVRPLLFYTLARFQRLRFTRSVDLFFYHYGTVMAAGAAYMIFFSASAVLFAGFAMAGIVVGNNQQYQDWLIEAVDSAVPGLLGEGALVEDPSVLFQIQGLNVTVAIAVVVAAITSLSWLHGLRSGIRSIFERPLMAENIILVKLRDLAIMAVLAVLGLTSVAVEVLSRSFAAETLQFLGWDSSALSLTLTRTISVAVPFVLDLSIAILLLRVASRLVIPASALWQSILIAAVGTSILRIGSGAIFENFGNGMNPVIASATAVLGLFFYFFLFSLIYLLACSWGAVTAAEHTANRSVRRRAHEPGAKPQATIPRKT